jgi:hypothetical protein
MMSVNPFAFGGEQRSVLLLLSVFSTSFLIPALGVVLMKPLGLIKGLQMRDKQERIGPYIVCGVFYLWLYKNFMGGMVPELYAKFTLGACIALFLAFFVNIFSKISMYATGMGSLIASDDDSRICLARERIVSRTSSPEPESFAGYRHHDGRSGRVSHHASYRS